MSEFRHIIRIGGNDIDGKKKVTVALADLKGIGPNIAHMIITSLKIDNSLRFGTLTDEQISEIESSLKNLSGIGIPSWALNRRKDVNTGSDLHLLGGELQMNILRGIENEKSVMSWRGIRHSLGLKVRGQRTRCSGRKGGSVSVAKSVRAPTTAAPTGAAVPTAPTAAAASAAKPAAPAGKPTK